MILSLLVSAVHGLIKIVDIGKQNLPYKSSGSLPAFLSVSVLVLKPLLEKLRMR